MQRYLVVGALVVGSAAVLFCWTVVDYLFWVARQERERHAGEKGPCTFLCRDVDFLWTVRGTFRDLGEHHIVITDADGWPHVIDRRDVLGVTA